MPRTSTFSWAFTRSTAPRSVRNSNRTKRAIECSRTKTNRMTHLARFIPESRHEALQNEVRFAPDSGSCFAVVGSSLRTSKFSNQIRNFVVYRAIHALTFEKRLRHFHDRIRVNDFESVGFVGGRVLVCIWHVA